MIQWVGFSVFLISSTWTDFWIFSFVFGQLVGWLDSGLGWPCLYFNIFGFYIFGGWQTISRTDSQRSSSLVSLEKQNQYNMCMCVYRAVFYKQLAHIIMKADKSQDWQSCSWRPRTYCVVQSGSRGLRTRRASRV